MFRFSLWKTRLESGLCSGFHAPDDRQKMPLHSDVTEKLKAAACSAGKKIKLSNCDTFGLFQMGTKLHEYVAGAIFNLN